MNKEIQKALSQVPHNVRNPIRIQQNKLLRNLIEPQQDTPKITVINTENAIQEESDNEDNKLLQKMLDNLKKINFNKTTPQNKTSQKTSKQMKMAVFLRTMHCNKAYSIKNP